MTYIVSVTVYKYLECFVYSENNNNWINDLFQTGILHYPGGLHHGSSLGNDVSIQVLEQGLAKTGDGSFNQ